MRDSDNFQTPGKMWRAVIAPLILDFNSITRHQLPVLCDDSISSRTAITLSSNALAEMAVQGGIGVRQLRLHIDQQLQQLGRNSADGGCSAQT